MNMPEKEDVTKGEKFGRNFTGEKMKTVSFQIRPSDYHAAQAMFDSMGLSSGAGIRFAILELMRNRGEGKK